MLSYGVIGDGTRELAGEMANQAVIYFWAVQSLPDAENTLSEITFRMLRTSPRTLLSADSSILLIAKDFDAKRLEIEVRHDLKAAIAEAVCWGLDLKPEFI